VSDVIEVHDWLRNKVRAIGAEDWLAALPDLVASLSSEWGLRLGRAYDGGTEAYVAEAWLEDGTPAVLKLLVPRDDGIADHEVTALRLADGDDHERLALLVERLGPSMFDLGLQYDRRLPLLCDTASRVWRPAPDAGLRTGAEKGRWLAESIARTWEELDRPCAERTVADAIESAERRISAHDDERAVLVHGDVHQWNALSAGDGFKLVDPDGLLAQPEYDLGILMREDPDEIDPADPHRRSRWLAARTGLDEGAIWEWGVVERVSTGLVCTSIDLQPSGREMLAVADQVVGVE
jgi:streptomycin 6-kinase